MMTHKPDGELVPDDRMPFFKLMEWVADPFPEEVAPEEDSGLLHGRYKVERALAFTNTGGVYYAEDQITGLRVVIKEARPHTLIWGPKKVALDAIVVLKNEWATLQRLHGLSCVPQSIEFYQEWEHTFLVQTFFEGISLGQFRALDGFMVMSKMDDPDEIIRFSREWRKICIQLLDAVDAIHSRGVIIGDISPGNVLINRDSMELALIDFEGALLSGADEDITRLGTQWFNPGFRKQESRQAESLSNFDDSYSCGMLLYNLVCPIQSLFELDKNAPLFRILDHFIEAGLPTQVRTIIQALLEGKAEKARHLAESWNLPEAIPNTTLGFPATPVNQVQAPAIHGED
jgi:serine/threonine protein kinase